MDLPLPASGFMVASGHKILKSLSPTWPKIQVGGTSDRLYMSNHSFSSQGRNSKVQVRRNKQIHMLFQKFSGFLRDKAKAPDIFSCLDSTRAQHISGAPGHSASMELGLLSKN